jgi:hypothetical protein
MHKYLAVAATTLLLTYSAMSFAMTEADSQMFLKEFPGVFAKGTCKKLLPTLTPSTCECIGSKVALHIGEKKGLLNCTEANMDSCMDKVEGDALADVTQKDIDACTASTASVATPAATAPDEPKAAAKAAPEPAAVDESKTDAATE